MNDRWIAQHKTLEGLVWNLYHSRDSGYFGILEGTNKRTPIYPELLDLVMAL